MLVSRNCERVQGQRMVGNQPFLRISFECVELITATLFLASYFSIYFFRIIYGITYFLVDAVYT